MRYSLRASCAPLYKSHNSAGYAGLHHHRKPGQKSSRPLLRRFWHRFCDALHREDLPADGATARSRHCCPGQDAGLAEHMIARQDGNLVLRLKIRQTARAGVSRGVAPVSSRFCARSFQVEELELTQLLPLLRYHWYGSEAWSLAPFFNIVVVLGLRIRILPGLLQVLNVGQSRQAQGGGWNRRRHLLPWGHPPCLMQQNHGETHGHCRHPGQNTDDQVLTHIPGEHVDGDGDGAAE
mmetsp:Transcript_21458/g.54843  ORF Transcript_21458/g.54843 Transcript_21458/m.54843 type:complete len:237 (-) Transcript_21458:109-819(-)